MPGAPALPTGTVTLLLTDVEGSTALWESDREVAAAAVARHRDLLDEAIARHRGVRPVEQGEGDSVVAAFEHPSDALAAVIDAQRAIGDEPWPDGGVIRIRAGVHTGEVGVRDHACYEGPTIIRAARLRDLGHGGQTLVSSATKDLVELVGGTEERVGFRYLGTGRLKGLDLAERVWQLCHPDLGTDFPRLAGLDEAPTNVPAPTTSFVGRDHEVAAVLAAVEADRLVSLCGVGGSGKTRLAQEVARTLVDTHPGGVWWVELATVASSAFVADAVADALSIHEAHDEAVLATVAGELRGRGAVIVLDNCEQVLDGSARVVDALLRALPDLRVLTTTREQLGLTGEVAWRVPSLDQAAAVDLFVERAAPARPGYRPDDEERLVIAEICDRLDGMPLAIELAAARVRVMHPRRIAAGLDDRFHLLTGGSRTATPRQQTLEASVDWSYRLLEAPDQALLRRLSVFSGGFTIEAAEAVAADDELDAYAVLDLLTGLVDKSLVQVDV